MAEIDALVPPGWSRFFSELSALLVTCRRRYGLASEQFAEYAIERLSQSFQGLQALAGATRDVDELSNIHADLLQLLESVQTSLQMWSDYFDILDSQRTLSSYTPPHMESSSHGRPKFDITRDQLQHLRSLSFSWTAIANMLKVTRMTIYRRRVEYGMLDESHSTISDEDLTEKVQEILTQHPHVGQTFVAGRLRSLGYRVTKERVRHVVNSVDPLSSALRWQGIMAHCRPYSVPGPNSLWHIDGHHKLIRWRIVTHGGIDGYSRLIVYLKCCGNNLAETVYRLFLKAVESFGLPSRVRSDFGGENYVVAQHMLQERGTDRGSMITGSSTHNQRIERLWVDMHRSVTRLFYNLFYFLEQHGLLDPLNELHLFALHYIYIPRINQALSAFQEGWNHHGMRTVSHLTPYQQFTRGALELHSSGLAALDFFHQVDTDYGVSIEDPVPVESDSTMIVPQLNFSLRGDEHNQLVAMFDPLQESDNYGIDLYISVVQLLNSFQS